jgi:hypothetical protein
MQEERPLEQKVLNPSSCLTSLQLPLDYYENCVLVNQEARESIRRFAEIQCFIHSAWRTCTRVASTEDVKLSCMAFNLVGAREEGANHSSGLAGSARPRSARVYAAIPWEQVGHLVVRC